MRFVTWIFIQLLLTSTCAMASPNVSFVSLPNSGISLAASGPNSATLTNNTDHDVLAFGIQWQFLGAGQDVQGIENEIYISWHEREKPQIKARSTRNISLSDFKSTAQSWASAASVKAALDVVIFDDGTCVGPDHTNAMETLSEKWRATQDVTQALLAKQGTASEAEIRTWAQDTLAKAQAHTLDTNNIYSTDTYDNFAAGLLKEFLRMCEHQHFQDAIGRAKSLTAAPTPKLQRRANT